MLMVKLVLFRKFVIFPLPRNFLHRMLLFKFPFIPQEKSIGQFWNFCVVFLRKADR